MNLQPWLGRLPIERFRNPPPVVSVIRLNGIISTVSAPLRGGALNLANYAAVIQRAFSAGGVKAVALAVNSPGGSPVQSALLAGRVRQLAAEKKLPVFAFTEDVAASGGYWLALAADEIYADGNSIIGSIGVISAGFGFTGLMEKLGVERRLYTQGDRKSFLDPFAPERPEDVARLERVQRDIHDSFKSVVRERRAGKLANPEDPDLFSGEFWTGRRALELGLIDGIGDLRSVMRQRYGEKVKLRVVAPGRSWLRRRLFSTAAPLAGLGDELFAAAAERALWARYGL